MARSSRPSSSLPSSRQASPSSPLQPSVLLAGAPCSFLPAHAGRFRTLVWELCWMYAVVPQLHIDPQPPWSFPATRLQAPSQLALCSTVLIRPSPWPSFSPACPFLCSLPWLALGLSSPRSTEAPAPTRVLVPYSPNSDFVPERTFFSTQSWSPDRRPRAPSPLPMATVPSSSPAP
jgi:hypothetical protein